MAQPAKPGTVPGALLDRPVRWSREKVQGSWVQSAQVEFPIAPMKAYRGHLRALTLDAWITAPDEETLRKLVEVVTMATLVAG